MTDDRDKFWDLSDLIPKKKSAPLPPFSHAVSFADVGSESASQGSGSLSKGELLLIETITQTPSRDEKKLTFPELPEQKRESVSYVPGKNRLITGVTVTRLLGGYRFYEEFRRDATVFFTLPGSPCEYAPFYSSMPQYAHLDPRQKSYYLYFRETVEKKKRVKCDESYLRLYIYEIINLPDRIPPSEGVVRLITLWRLYRERFPGLNMQLAGWIADYCLVHRLSCPLDELRPIMDTVMNATDFKEFYLGEAAEDADGGLGALLSALSDYSFSSGKYATGESAALFSEHIPASLLPVVKRLLSEEKATRDGTVKRTRRAFLGALCSYFAKYEITVEYRSFSGSLSLRRRVTAAVKYAENRLRGILAIRSRLAVSDIDGWAKAEIDRYFDRLSEQMKRERQTRERPAYEALYDAEDRTISFSGADEIERASWENAKRLVTEEEAPEEIPAQPVPEPAPDLTETGEDGFLTEEQIAFLAGLLARDRAAVLSAAERAGTSVDGMVETINERASEIFGDVVIESTEDGYAVIGDYSEEVAQWTKRK